MDLNNHQILYQSIRSDTHSTMQDQFIFIVCDAYRCSEAKIFVINIYHYNIMVVNTGFEVEEGSVHHITINELNILAPRDSIWLQFFIEQQPEHGNITLKTDIRVIIDVQFFDLADVVSGSILYENDGSEFLHDSFQFTATAQYHNEVTGNYETLLESDMVNITILPVNDNSPVIVRPLESYDVVKGGSTNIPGSLLQAHDPDSDMRDEDIVWQLQLGSPYNGYMYLDVDQGRMHSISIWTEGDLRKNRLYYRNDRAPPSGIDILFYTISDGFFTSDGDQRIILNVQEFIFESTATVDLLSTGAVLQIADHTPDPPVMTSSTQVDSTPLSSHAKGETALPRSLAQTQSTAILVGTMVPVVVIIASLVLLTSCATVIILRHHHHEDYPENDHIYYDYPDIQLPPVLPILQNKIECATVADLDSPQIVNRRKTATDDSRCSSSTDIDKSCVHNDSITDVAGKMERDEACTEFEDSIGIPVQENEAYKRCGTPLSGQSDHNAAPSGGHPMEYLNTDQTRFQVSGTPVDSESTVSHLDAVANTKIDATPNCNLPPSCTCVGIETISFSFACDSNQLAPQNETPTSMQYTDDSHDHDLKLQQTILDPNDAYTDSTLDPIQSGKYKDQSLTEQVPYPYDLKLGKETSAESIDSMSESTANEGASIGSYSAAHQCNSYERIWGYEKIHHCDIDLPEHSRSSCITQSATPLSSVEEEGPTESNHSGCSIQSMNGYEQVCGYEVIQHCDLKLEDLQ